MAVSLQDCIDAQSNTIRIVKLLEEYIDRHLLLGRRCRTPHGDYSDEVEVRLKELYERKGMGWRVTRIECGHRFLIHQQGLVAQNHNGKKEEKTAVSISPVTRSVEPVVSQPV